MARVWFPKSTPSSVAAQNAALQQQALDEIAQSTDATEQILSTPSPLPAGGATEGTLQNVETALGSEGGGVLNPPPAGGSGVIGWLRNLFELFLSMRSFVSGNAALKVDVVQTVGGGGGGGGDASAANQLTQITQLTNILAKLIAAPSTEAKQDAEIAAINAITTALGGSLTISLPAGISTEAKQDVIITGLASINTLLGAPLTVGGTVNVGNFPVTQPVSGTFWQATQPVSAAALPLPSGASTEATLAAILAKLIVSPATEAKQDALIALFPATLTALSNFKVAIQEALPAGTNAIGKLAANSGVDIGDVDVLSLPAIPAGTNVIGVVGIDQATPGTTNNVEVGKLPKASSANTPAIVTSGGDIIASNSSRKSWGIQNMGTNPLFVRMATGASSTLCHFVLAPGSVADDGRGMAVTDDTYTGVVSATGTSPRLIWFEL